MLEFKRDNVLDLLEQMKEGSQEAFGEFYERYSTFVYSVAFRLLKNKLEAEDITHEIFLEISKKPHQFQPDRGSVEAWLAVKTKSRCLDHLRRKRELPVAAPIGEYSGLSGQTSIDAVVMERLEKRMLAKAISKLPKAQRQAIIHRYYEEYTHKETAEKMGKPLGTIKSLVRYGLKSLRRHMLHMGVARPSKGDDHHGM